MYRTENTVSGTPEAEADASSVTLRSSPVLPIDLLSL